LKELINSYLKREIAESNIQDQDKFYRLVMILAQQTGSLVNVNELSKTLKLSVTADGHEIDFVINPASSPGSAIEIKFDEDNFNPKKYNNFHDAYPGFSINCRAFHSSGNINSLMAL